MQCNQQCEEASAPCNEGCAQDARAHEQRQRKHRRLQHASCIAILGLLAAAATPLIVLYWEEIVRFLEQLLPPCDRFVVRDPSCPNATEPGSGEEAANGTEGASGESGGSWLDATLAADATLSNTSHR